jgi:hypothetical protein
LQFFAPSGPDGGAAPYGGWAQSQPGYGAYPPPTQPGYGGGFPPAQPGYGGYPPGQPGPVGYAPAGYAPPPTKSGSGKLIAIIVIVLVVLGGGIGGFLYVRANTTNPSNPAFDRHGLPDNIPLPNGVTFKLMQNVTQTSGEVDQEWFWTVDGPNDPATVQGFYQSNFSNNGWTHVQSDSASGQYVVIGCQGGKIVGVLSGASVEVKDAQDNTTSTITAPSGGSALEIVTTDDTRVIAENCR